MLLEVGAFRTHVQVRLDDLVQSLQEITGRKGREEASAWRSSLTKLSAFLDRPALQGLHLYVNGKGHLSLEYPLPGASSWCDVVLLGRNAKGASALIIELKNWLTRNDEPAHTPGLIRRFSGLHLHPSDQVRGYTNYCQRFHSAVHEHEAAVFGTVLFTADRDYFTYLSKPNDLLAEEFPLFSTERKGDDDRFLDYCLERLSEPDAAFAEAFENGTYKQDRGFIRQMGTQIEDPYASPFELLDNQRYAFSVAKAHVESAVFSDRPIKDSKRVVAIVGPPGSGKSVIAIKLWAALALNQELPDGDLSFVTTSSSQSRNWQHLFNAIGNAGGVVKNATSFHPIRTNDIKPLRAVYGKEFLTGRDEWRKNLDALRAVGVPFRSGSEDNALLVSIVDEAHALVNTEHRDGYGTLGFPVTLGPQAYHIIRASQVSVFLLDPEQSFRDRESTGLEDISNWASELGITQVDVVDLGDAQFRCAGSKEYVFWLEQLLNGSESQSCKVLAEQWFKHSEELRVLTDYPNRINHVTHAAEGKDEVLDLIATNHLDFSIHDSPFDVEEKLRGKLDLGFSVRWLSSYSREWRTEKAAEPHLLPPSMQDFNERIWTEDGVQIWSKPWNYVPGYNYTLFVQGLGTYMASDPLSEVGCPYVVRGFDFDYVGILWLEDLVWRNGRWAVQQEHCHERGNKRARDRAKAEEDPHGPAHMELLEAVVQAYRIVFTRAIRGVHVWIKDDETRRHVAACLGISR